MALDEEERMHGPISSAAKLKIVEYPDTPALERSQKDRELLQLHSKRKQDAGPKVDSRRTDRDTVKRGDAGDIKEKVRSNNNKLQKRR